MALSDQEREAMETLATAFADGAVCLLQVRHKATGEDHPLICLVHYEDNGEGVQLRPVARLVVDDALLDEYEEPTT